MGTQTSKRVGDYKDDGKESALETEQNCKASLLLAPQNREVCAFNFSILQNAMLLSGFVPVSHCDASLFFQGLTLSPMNARNTTDSMMYSFKVSKYT